MNSIIPRIRLTTLHSVTPPPPPSGLRRGVGLILATFPLPFSLLYLSRPRDERYKSLRALNTSPPRNRFASLRGSYRIRTTPPMSVRYCPRGYGVSSSRLFKTSLKSAAWVHSYDSIAQQISSPETSLFPQQSNP